jgi:hypothetical protein
VLQLEVELFTLRGMVVDGDDDWPFGEHDPNDTGPIERATWHCARLTEARKTAVVRSGERGSPMSREVNLGVVEAMWLAWNDKRLRDAADSIAEHAHFRHFSLDIELEGREAILNLMEHSLTALPERKSTVLHTHATDDYVITENHYEGALAETGESITKNICYIFRLEDGLIVDWREYG